MNAESNSSGERDYLGKALDIAVRLAVIAIILLAIFRIFSPFLAVVVWAAVIAIALFPLYGQLRKACGGRGKLAGGIFIVVSLACVLIPTILLTDSLLDVTVRFVDRVEAGTVQVPPPTEKVKDWPLIGEKTYALWLAASKDLRGTTAKLQPQLARAAEKVVAAVAGLGSALIQCILSLIIAGILMMSAKGARGVADSVAGRLAGKDGPAMVETSIGTIRSVVKGVILVALIQGLLSAVGLAIADVPGIGLWALLVVVVAIIQLPPILILGPIIVWVFANNDSTAIAIFFTIWSLVVSSSDSFLKPLFLGRGVQVPMLIILIGAIGGMLSGGVVGLFIGPVIFAIGYQLFKAWVEDESEGAQTQPGLEAKS